MQPRAEYLKLFREIVIDAWKQKNSESRTVTETVSRNLAVLKQKKDRLNDAFIDQRSIDQETYNERLGQLREEIAHAEQTRTEAEVEEIDVDTLIDFAIDVLGGASSFWRECSADQKQRFQSILFPEGVRFDGESCGTAVTCLAFNVLPTNSANNSSLASRTGVEPVSPP